MREGVPLAGLRSYWTSGWFGSSISGVTVHEIVNRIVGWRIPQVVLLPFGDSLLLESDLPTSAYQLLRFEQAQSVTWVKIDLRQNGLMSLGVMRIVAET